MNEVTKSKWLSGLPKEKAKRCEWFAEQAACRVDHDDYKNILRMYCKKCVAVGQAIAQEAYLKAGVIQSLDEGEPLVRTVECDVCGENFSGHAAVAAHKAKSHTVFARATRAVTGAKCEVCCKEFWVRARLRQHFSHSRSCMLAHLESDLPPYAPSTVEVDVGLPVAKLPGPQPWWATLRPDIPQHEAPVAPATRSLSERLCAVNSVADAQGVLAWWQRYSDTLNDSEIQDCFESISLKCLQGLRLATLKVVEFLILPEADLGAWRVSKVGGIYFVFRRTLVQGFDHAERCFLNL